MSLSTELSENDIVLNLNQRKCIGAITLCAKVAGSTFLKTMVAVADDGLIGELGSEFSSSLPKKASHY